MADAEPHAKLLSRPAQQGIGRFEGFKANGGVALGKYTLIFAENGVGKTTLCDVTAEGSPGR